MEKNSYLFALFVYGRVFIRTSSWELFRVPHKRLTEQTTLDALTGKFIDSFSFPCGSCFVWILFPSFNCKQMQIFYYFGLLLTFLFAINEKPFPSCILFIATAKNSAIATSPGNFLSHLVLLFRAENVRASAAERSFHFPWISSGFLGLVDKLAQWSVKCWHHAGAIT